MRDIGNWRHICVDAQRMFAEDTPWHVPWMARVLPQLEEISRRHAERTIFTRFMTPAQADNAVGGWKEYYRKWWMMTGEYLPKELFGLAPSLQAFVSPGSHFRQIDLFPMGRWQTVVPPQSEGVQTVVVTGGETDVSLHGGPHGRIIA